MAANRNEQLAKELGYQWSLKSWVEYDDSLLSKPQNQLTGYDKATLNINPDLKAKREAYQASLVRSNRLQSDLNNIQNAQQFLQNNVSQQKERINRLYDLQDKAAAISASIQWTNRVAGWLWAASNVLGNSRWITDAQMQQQILQNDAQRESALANVAQQEANIPSVLASLDQANANAELARAQADYYWNQNSTSWWGSSRWYSYSSWWNHDKKEQWWDYTIIDTIDYNWNKIKWAFLKDKNWSYYDAVTWDKIYDAETKKWSSWFLTSTDPDNLDSNTDTSKNKKDYWNRMPSWTVIPTLWTWALLWTNKNTKNIWFTNIGKRITL